MIDEEIKNQLCFLFQEPIGDISSEDMQAVMPLIRSLEDDDFRSWYLSLATQYLTKLGAIEEAMKLLPEIQGYYNRAEAILLLATKRLDKGELYEATQLIQNIERITKTLQIDDEISNWQKADVLMQTGDFYGRTGNDNLALEDWIAADGFAQHDNTSRMQYDLVKRLIDKRVSEQAKAIALSIGAPAYREAAIKLFEVNESQNDEG
jgi:tetratricopeptide (TPR) repeat protein